MPKRDRKYVNNIFGKKQINLDYSFCDNLKLIKPIEISGEINRDFGYSLISFAKENLDKIRFNSNLVSVLMGVSKYA